MKTSKPKKEKLENLTQKEKWRRLNPEKVYFGAALRKQILKMDTTLKNTAENAQSKVPRKR